MDKDTPEEKRCPQCGHIKPRHEWNKNRSRYDGLAVWCKTCMASYHREWRSRPDVQKRQSEMAAARYAGMTDEERRAYIDRGVELRKKRGHGHNLMSKYGISIGQYDSIVESQGGGCAMCGKTREENGGRRLSVDHDHGCCPGEKSCGKCVRGILCVTCNVWLGYFENQEWTQRARSYLSSYGERMLEILGAQTVSDEARKDAA